MISTCLIRFYFIFLCLKNGRNFNVVIVSFLPSDHRNDPDLLVFAVSCLSFFDANGTQLFFVLRRKRDSKYFFDFYVYFIRTNIWYVFVRWYNSTENFHVRFSHHLEYIFHVQDTGTYLYRSRFLQTISTYMKQGLYGIVYTYQLQVQVYMVVLLYRDGLHT